MHNILYYYLCKDNKGIENIERRRSEYNNNNDDDDDGSRVVYYYITVAFAEKNLLKPNHQSQQSTATPPRQPQNRKRLQTIIIIIIIITTTTAAAHRYVITKTAPRWLFDKFPTSFYCRRRILRFYTDFSRPRLQFNMCIWCIYCIIAIVVSSVVLLTISPRNNVCYYNLSRVYGVWILYMCVGFERR